MNTKRWRMIAYILAGVGAIVVLVWFLWGRHRITPVGATYTDAYVQAHRGTVLVEVPETHELATIALALTDYGVENPFRIAKESDYYAAVLAHFMPYKDHPLIATIEYSDKQIADFLSFQVGSMVYRFEDDKLVADEVYQGIRWFNPFKQRRALLEDFARESGFRDFYAAHQPYYTAQVAAYEEAVPIRQMWTWLEDQFPARYDAYHVVFSPLTGASHTTAHFNENGFSETVMFVAGPDFYADAPEALHPLLLSKLVFTEIDHNYVDPLVEQHARRVKRALQDLDKWNTQSSYRTSTRTFREYMTWGVFTLYAFDHYDGQRFLQIKTILEKEMLGRGFVRFPAFNDHLLSLYQQRAPGETLADLLPKILTWVDSVD